MRSDRLMQLKMHWVPIGQYNSISFLPCRTYPVVESPTSGWHWDYVFAGTEQLANPRQMKCGSIWLYIATSEPLNLAVSVRECLHVLRAPNRTQPIHLLITAHNVSKLRNYGVSIRWLLNQQSMGLTAGFPERCGEVRLGFVLIHGFISDW